MRLVDSLLCLTTVTLVSLGQVLLRQAALAAANSERSAPFNLISGSTLVALVVYGAAMMLWLFVLSRVPLSYAFSYFGLSFFFVPLISGWMLNDPVGPNTWLGAAIIFVGVIVSNSQS